MLLLLSYTLIHYGKCTFIHLDTPWYKLRWFHCNHILGAILLTSKAVHNHYGIMIIHCNLQYIDNWLLLVKNILVAIANRKLPNHLWWYHDYVIAIHPSASPNLDYFPHQPRDSRTSYDRAIWWQMPRPIAPPEERQDRPARLRTANRRCWHRFRSKPPLSETPETDSSVFSALTYLRRPCICRLRYYLVLLHVVCADTGSVCTYSFVSAVYSILLSQYRRLHRTSFRVLRIVSLDC